MSVENTARQIRKLLEAEVEKLSKNSPAYDAPYIQESRGGSTVPFTEAALTWLDSGVRFTSRDGKDLERWRQDVCRSTLSDLRSKITRVPFNGVSLWAILSILASEPGSVRWIENGASKIARDYRTAFSTICTQLAQGFRQIHPDVHIVVSLSPSEEMARPKTMAAYHKERTINAHASYRLLYEQLLRMEDEQNLNRTAAREQLAQEKDCSVWRIQDAITYCTRQAEGAA